MNQIRLNKTPEIVKVLSFLQGKYSILSEAEILKIALSEKYYREAEDKDKEKRIKQAWEQLKKEGKKIGNKLMRDRGLDPKKVTEQQFHDLILDTHKHNA